MQKIEMHQRYGTYELGYTPVGTLIQTPLNAGYYSLSSMSNVPYVSIVGSGGNEKTFSWGEIIYVAPGENARVKNASYHPGEITLNGGKDFCTMPGRITIPVSLTITNVPTFTFKTAFPLDTRRAKRAWLYLNTVADVGCSCSKIGKAVRRAHNTTNTVSPGPGYTFVESIVAGSQVLQIALGASSTGTGNDAMALLDTAELTMQNLTVDPRLASSYYVLEY